MNEKHTPGPWAWNPQNDTIIVNQPGGEYIGSMIAKIATGEDIRQEHANARLIAAAPELLEALKIALGQMEGSKPLNAVHMSSLKADIQIVRAAITKAQA